MRIPCLLGSLFLLLLCGCHDGLQATTEPVKPTQHDTTIVREDRGMLTEDEIREASGLAASRRNPEVLWTHNDSGDSPRLFALNTKGQHLGTYNLSGASARDWEDMALGPGPNPGMDYLYVGDIGDNAAQHDLKVIYRVAEPTVDQHQQPSVFTLNEVDVITLRYPDGPRDAETLMVDPFSRDLYIISKRSTIVNVYRAAYPQSLTDIMELELATTLTLDASLLFGQEGWGAVAGDIAPSGLAVLVKTYDKIYQWTRTATTDSLFGGTPKTLPYIIEPQGEAIAWAADGSGYFTVSEERQNIPARLYFYPFATP